VKNGDNFDPFIVNDSVSSGSSFFDDDQEDFYSNSILASTQIKDQEELVDVDLVNLLQYILKMNLPTEEVVKSKSVELGEFTRMKTLIFDLDETLIHSWQITPQKQDEINKEFEIELQSGLKYGIAVRPYMAKCLTHLG